MLAEKYTIADGASSCMCKAWLEGIILDNATYNPRFPDRRTIQSYVDRVMDQYGNIEMEIDKKELVEILNRRFYPAMLSKLGYAIESLISHFDKKAIIFLLEQPLYRPFILGFMGVIAIYPDMKNEISEFLENQEINKREWSEEGNLTIFDFSQATEVIRFIQLNTYEPKAVHQLVTQSNAGFACVLGILGGYCHVLEGKNQ